MLQPTQSPDYIIKDSTSVVGKMTWHWMTVICLQNASIPRLEEFNVSHVCYQRMHWY